MIGKLQMMTGRRTRLAALCLLLSVSLVAPQIALALSVLAGASDTTVVLCTGSGLIRVSLADNEQPSPDTLSGSTAIADDPSGLAHAPGSHPSSDNTGEHCALASAIHPADHPHTADNPPYQRLAASLRRSATDRHRPLRYARPAERAPPTH